MATQSGREGVKEGGLRKEVVGKDIQRGSISK